MLRLGGLAKEEISYINSHGGTLGWSLLLNTVRPAAGAYLADQGDDADGNNDDGAKTYSTDDAPQKDEL